MESSSDLSFLFAYLNGSHLVQTQAEASRTKAARERERALHHLHPDAVVLNPPNVNDIPHQQQQQQHRQQRKKDDGDGNGKLHLSLATAVLSVAQRLSTVEETASTRVKGAESLARQALEAARKEASRGVRPWNAVFRE